MQLFEFFGQKFGTCCVAAAADREQVATNAANTASEAPPSLPQLVPDSAQADDSPRPSAHGYFLVTLEKPSDAKWAIELDFGQSYSLYVLRVGDGPVSRYNQTAQDKMIEPGDWIEKINSIAHNPAAMAEAMKSQNVMQLIVRKSWYTGDIPEMGDSTGCNRCDGTGASVPLNEVPEAQNSTDSTSDDEPLVTDEPPIDVRPMQDSAAASTMPDSTASSAIIGSMPHGNLEQPFMLHMQRIVEKAKPDPDSPRKFVNNQDPRVWLSSLRQKESQAEREGRSSEVESADVGPEVVHAESSVPELARGIEGATAEKAAALADQSLCTQLASKTLEEPETLVGTGVAGELARSESQDSSCLESADADKDADRAPTYVYPDSPGDVAAGMAASLEGSPAFGNFMHVGTEPVEAASVYDAPVKEVAADKASHDSLPTPHVLDSSTGADDCGAQETLAQYSVDLPLAGEHTSERPLTTITEVEHGEAANVEIGETSASLPDPEADHNFKAETSNSITAYETSDSEADVAGVGLSRLQQLSQGPDVAELGHTLGEESQPASQPALPCPPEVSSADEGTVGRRSLEDGESPRAKAKSKSKADAKEEVETLTADTTDANATDEQLTEDRGENEDPALASFADRRSRFEAVDEEHGAQHALFDIEAHRLFLIDNSELQAPTPGLALRGSLRMDDKISEVVEWGSILQAAVENDDWIRVGNVFLPIFLNGCRVVREVDPRSLPMQAEKLESVPEDVEAQDESHTEPDAAALPQVEFEGDSLKQEPLLEAPVAEPEDEASLAAAVGEAESVHAWENLAAASDDGRLDKAMDEIQPKPPEASQAEASPQSSLATCNAEVPLEGPLETGERKARPESGHEGQAPEKSVDAEQAVDGDAAVPAGQADKQDSSEVAPESSERRSLSSFFKPFGYGAK